jgi:hypothetical protein
MTRLSIQRSAVAVGLLAGALGGCTTQKAPPPPTTSPMPAASAALAKLDPRRTTCAEFLSLSADVRPRVVAWMDGYSRGRLKTQEVGVLDVDRQTDTLVVACQESPKVTFWDKVRDHLPGGSKQVKPAAMTCEEFANLSQSERPEVAYFADGYNHGVKEEDVGVVDFKRDVNTIVVACKPTPKESVWTKIKQAF